MFRKALLAVSALTVIGAAALAPTAASAKPWHHHHKHGWHGGGIYIGTPYYASYGGGYYGGSCWIKRWVDTPFGPRLKRVYVCY